MREKGISFETDEVNLAQGARLEGPYRDASLTARIPSLQYNGFRLSESSAIAEYLEEMFRHPTARASFRRMHANGRGPVSWLLRNGHDVPARLRRYADAQWMRPSARAFVEHARPAVVPATYWAFSGTPEPENGSA